MKARITLGALVLALLVWIVLRDRASDPSEPASGEPATGEPVTRGERAAEAPPALRGRADADREASVPQGDRKARASDEPPTVLEGRVATTDGSPVPGVVVRILNSYLPPTEVARVPTDDDGCFRLDDAPPGTLKVLVAGGGWVSERGRYGRIRAPASVTATVKKGRVARVAVVVVPAATAFGHITDGPGRPVAGAELRALAPPAADGSIAALMGLLDGARNAPLAVTTADEDGAYRLDGLEDGAEYVLEAVSPRHEPARSGTFRARLEAPEEVDLVVRAGRFVVVTVRTVEGRPIPNVRVWAHPSGASLAQLGRPLKRARTDAAGRAKLGPFARVPVEVGVHAFGFLSDSERDDPPRIVPVDQDSIVIRLERGRTITGRLFDAEGRPVGGATVQAQRREESENGYSITGFESARTAADGSFEIEGLPDGPLTLWAETREPPIRETGLLVESGARDVRIAFGSDSASGLELVILDPDGRPVPQVSVEYGVFAPRDVVGGRVHLTHLRSHHPDGRTRIRVFDPRDGEGNPLPLAEAIATWREGEPRVLEVHLESERVLRGFVLGPDGSGLAGTLVVASPHDGSTRRTVQTAADGSFEIRALGAGGLALDVRVTGDLIAPPTHAVESIDDPVVIHVRIGIRPLLRVLDPAGEPVAGAAVFASSSADAALAEGFASAFGLEQRTLADGTLRLPTLDPDAALRLRVEPPDDRSDLGRLVVEPWRPADERLRLPSALTITGVVRDLDGRPVPNAAVHVAPADVPPRTTWADEHGAFEVRSLEPGSVRLRARLPVQWVTGEFVFLGPEVEVQAGAPGVVLEGDAGGSLLVQVEDASGQHDGPEGLLLPVDAAPPLCVHHGRSEGAGRLRFFGLRRDRTYALWIEPSDDAPDASLLRTGVRVGADVLRVRRVPGRTVEGRLELPPGARFPSVRAVDGFLQREGVVQSDGSFVIRGLPDRPWVVTARAWGSRGPLEGEAKVDWGTSLTIRLELPDGSDD